MVSLGENIFVASTTYHILIACCLYKEGDVLIIAGNKDYGTLVKELLLKTFESDLFIILSLKDYKSDVFKLIKFRKFMKQLEKNILEKNIIDIVIFNDVDPETQWIINNIKRTGKVILIEEGIGLYRDIKKRHEFVFKIFGKILFGHKFENIKRIGESKSVEQIICRNPSLLSSKQHMKEVGKLDIIDFESLKNKLSNLKEVEENIWFIGQPLVEDGILKEKEYLEIVNKIKDKNPNLIIKPHPRENINKYNSIFGAKLVEDNNIPIELMVNTKKNNVFLTIYSSAIISVSSYGKAMALFKIAGIKLPDEVEKIFLQASVQILNNWNEVVLNEKN